MTVTRWLVIYEDGHEEYKEHQPEPDVKYPKQVNIQHRTVRGAYGLHHRQHSWDIEYVPAKHIVKLEGEK